MTSGAICAVYAPSCLMASTVACTSATLPPPTSGTMMGGCGTTNAPTRLMVAPPNRSREEKPRSYRSDCR